MLIEGPERISSVPFLSNIIYHKELFEPLVVREAVIDKGILGVFSKAYSPE